MLQTIEDRPPQDREQANSLWMSSDARIQNRTYLSCDLDCDFVVYLLKLHPDFVVSGAQFRGVTLYQVECVAGGEIAEELL